MKNTCSRKTRPFRAYSRVLPRPPYRCGATDARSLLLHGQGDNSDQASDRRADVAGHFILRLACCGVVARAKGQEGNEHQGGEDAGRLRDRREWFVRAEKDLFQARLRSYIQEGGDRDDREGGATGRGGEERKRAAVIGRQQALRLVYDLGWLRPVGRDDLQPTVNSLSPLTLDLDSSFSSSGRGDHCGETGSFCSINGGQQHRHEGPEAGKKRARPVRELERHQAEGGGSLYGETTCGNHIQEEVNGGREHTRRAQDGEECERCLRKVDAGTRASSTIYDTADGNGYTYFSCPFDRVLLLVRSRQVLLNDGMALLTPEQIPAAVVQHFESQLRKGLSVSQKALPGVEEDERVRDMLIKVNISTFAISW